MTLLLKSYKTKLKDLNIIFLNDAKYPSSGDEKLIFVDENYPGLNGVFLTLILPQKNQNPLNVFIFKEYCKISGSPKKKLYPIDLPFEL